MSQENWFAETFALCQHELVRAYCPQCVGDELDAKREEERPRGWGEGAAAAGDVARGDGGPPVEGFEFGVFVHSGVGAPGAGASAADPEAPGVWGTGVTVAARAAERGAVTPACRPTG